MWAAAVMGARAVLAADEPPADWRKLLAEDRPAEAIPLIEAEWRIRPSDPELWRALGETYWRIGRLDAAEEITRQWLRLDAENADAHELMARVSLAQDNIEEAIASLRRVLELKPDHPDAPFLLARALRWAGRLPEAVERMRALHAAHPDDREILLELARATSSFWEYDEALKLWMQLREAEPSNLEFMAEEARASLHTGAARAAVISAREVLRRDSANFTALQVLADEAQYGGRPVEAVEWLEKWRELATDPDDRAYLISRILGLELRLHQTDPRRWPIEKIIERARAQLAERPDSAESHLTLAELLVGAGKWNEAEIMLLRFLREFNPNSLRAHAALMELALGRGDFREAERQLAFVRDFHPEDPYHYFRHAQLLHARGDEVAALRALDRLAEAGKRGAAAVLLYHALTTSEYGPARSVREFREHVRALQLAGYTLLTPDELRPWWDRFGPTAGLLPDGRVRRAALITFDDALENSLRFGTAVALDRGICLAMHIPVGLVERGEPYVVSWETLRRYAATGAWVYGSHLRFASDLVPVDREGRRLAYAAAARRWIPEDDRLETETEFYARLRDEYRLSREAIERETGQPARFVAYPYGEIGQEMISNVPDARPIHLAYARRYYEVGFIQTPFAHATRDADPLLYPRHEFPLGTSGEDVVDYLLDHHPVLLAERTRVRFAAEDGRPADARRAIARLRAYGYPEERAAELEAGLRAQTSRYFSVPDLDPRLENTRTPPKGARIGAGVEYFENNFDTQRSFWSAAAEQIIGSHVLLTVEGGFGRADQPRPRTPEVEAAAVAARPNVELDERRGLLTLSWVGEDRTVARAEAGGYSATGDADESLFIGAVELSGRLAPELDLRGRVERQAPEDAAAVAEGISFYQGMVEAVWSACPDFDIGATASVRWYSDGNRRTSLSLTPAYRPLAWRGFYLGARYSTILSERAEPWYWTPDQLDGAYALAGFRGRALGGYLGVEAQGGLAREKMFAEPPEPAPPDSWEAAYGGSLYWEAPRRRRLDGRIQLNYSQTPEYEELQAGARILLRF